MPRYDVSHDGRMQGVSWYMRKIWDTYKDMKINSVNLTSKMHNFRIEKEISLFADITGSVDCTANSTSG